MKMTELKACYMCDNARLNDELTDDNDFSSMAIDCFENYRIMYSAGYGKPPRLEFEIWNGNHWSTVSTYYPKYCPNCGRTITEYGDLEQWNRRGEQNG